MGFARCSRAAGALLLAAAAAAVMTHRAASPPSLDVPAGVAAEDLIDSGHTAVDDYLKDAKAARLAANREADTELAISRHQAAAEAALRATDARAETGKATRVASAIPLPPLSPVAVQQQQVAQVAQEAAPQPAKQPMLARVVSTVTRLPGWVGSNVVGAAAWVVELPGQVVRLPERRFL